MTTNETPYKSITINEPLPACSVDYRVLNRLLDILIDVNKEAVNIDFSAFKKLENESDDDFSKRKGSLKALYQVSVTILGSKGEFIFFDSPISLDEAKLPTVINKVIFDTGVKYNFQLKCFPPNRAKLEFDFSKARIFDLQSLPSEPTPNSSCIEVIGTNETWVCGVHKKILGLIEEHLTKGGLLHKSNVYDLLIWFLFIPITFTLIYRLENWFHTSQKLPVILTVACYFYTFLLSLNIFRILFNYSRWVLPKVELIGQHQSNSALHRGIIVAIFSALSLSLLYDIVRMGLSLPIK